MATNHTRRLFFYTDCILLLVLFVLLVLIVRRVNHIERFHKEGRDRETCLYDDNQKEYLLYVELYRRPTLEYDFAQERYAYYRHAKRGANNP